MQKNKNCHKFNENSKTFTEILDYVTKINGERYSQPSSINSIYLRGLKKILKPYLNYLDIEVTDDQLNQLVTQYDIQHMLYSLLADIDNIDNYTITTQKIEKNEK